MEDFDLIIKILVPLAIGAVIGIERQVDPNVETPDKKGGVVLDMGLRTFSLVGLIGALSGLSLSANPLIAGIISVTFLILILVNYTIGVIYTKDLGITTEISLFYTYFAGILIASGIVPIAVILAVTVIVVLLLSQKRKIHKTVATIEPRELNSFISYAILALVVLPFLPNYTFALSEIPGIKALMEQGVFERIKDINLINPYKLWLIVVLMTGVDMAGYILERTLGKGKSLLITSLAGGFISSTATTQALANQSERARTTNLYVGASLFSNMASFFQISILIAAVNSALLIQSLPVIFALIASTFAAGLFFFLRDGSASKSSVIEGASSHKMFNLYPALKFMGLFLLINILSKVSLEFLGESGFLITSGVGALAGIDAVTISASELAGSRIDFNLAILGILIANAVNLIAKTFYAFSSGAKNFALRFGGSVIFVIGLSLLAYFLF